MQVIGCSFLDCYEHSIDLHNPSYAIVMGNYCENEHKAAHLALRTSGSETEEPENWVIGNEFRGAGSIGMLLRSRPLNTSSQAKHLWAVNNLVSSSGSEGIRIAGGRAHNMSLVGNEIAHNTEFGIIMYGGRNINFRNNYIHSNGDYGIQIHDSANEAVMKNIVINGNWLVDNTGTSVRISLNGDSDVASLLVQDNDMIAVDTSPSRAVSFAGTGGAAYSEVALQRNNAVGFSQPYYFNSLTPDYVQGNTPTKPVNVLDLKQETGNQSFHDGSGYGRQGFAYKSPYKWLYTKGAEEAAGAGNSPYQGNFTTGQIVENTDDNTIWMKSPSGTMIQLG
jgi:parallel beta-helix repeat protein